jgi:predicted nucleotidyltransferase
MDSLRRVAIELSIPERTLRRAASEGLIRGERVSPRRFQISLSEESYIRTRWPLLRSLRAALRTEPTVRLAVLFGTTATGEGDDGSDLAILVALRDEDVRRLVTVSERLSGRLNREVHLVPLVDAERSPASLLEVLEEGRVLIDRDQSWSQLHGGVRKLRRTARREDRDSLSGLDRVSLADDR